MNFGDALENLQDGYHVRRETWKHKGMFLLLVPRSAIQIAADRPLGMALPNEVGKTVHYQPHIDKYMGDGTLVPWVPSQEAILADDWEIVDDV